MQEKHPQWEWQWQTFFDDSQWLFTEWIKPNTLEDFRGKDVLDCGCGGGQHLMFTAPYAKHITGVDFNALSVARKNTENLNNVTLIEAELAEMDLGKISTSSTASACCTTPMIRQKLSGTLCATANPGAA